jgi:hypothetical protein
MKRAMVSGAIALAILTAGSVATRADQIFDYSFTNVSGSVAGTVTGHVDLPFNGDGSGPATHVFIDSYPAALGNIGNLEATTWSTPLSNNFVVSGGSPAQTGTVYSALDAASPGPDLVLEPLIGELLTNNGFVLGPITWSQQTTTPEPASLTLLGVSLFTFGASRVWRRRKDSNIAA